MATGGLLGNVLFFAASGFCLFRIKESFPKWYLKRIVKIYPIIVCFTFFTVLIGDYTLSSGLDFVRLFIYPTNYIFIVWLMASYVVFYIVAWLSKKWEKTVYVAFGVVLALWLLTYLIFVDKSVYNIDEVSKPFIVYLYMLGMLMGAILRKHIDKFSEFKWINLVLLALSIVLYFGSKIAFSRIQSIAWLQILNQIIILAVVYFIFVVLMSLEVSLKKVPGLINRIVKFVSGITLHIYIVQFVVIRRLEGLIFPVNLLATTAAILALASTVYCAEYFIKKGITVLANRVKRKKANAENNA